MNYDTAEHNLESMPVQDVVRILDRLEDGVALRASGTLGHSSATVRGETLGDQAEVYREKPGPYSEEEHGQQYWARNLDRID